MNIVTNNKHQYIKYGPYSCIGTWLMPVPTDFLYPLAFGTNAHQIVVLPDAAGMSGGMLDTVWNQNLSFRLHKCEILNHRRTFEFLVVQKKIAWFFSRHFSYTEISGTRKASLKVSFLGLSYCRKITRSVPPWSGHFILFIVTILTFIFRCGHRISIRHVFYCQCPSLFWAQLPTCTCDSAAIVAFQCRMLFTAHKTFIHTLHPWKLRRSFSFIVCTSFLHSSTSGDSDLTAFWTSSP